MKRSAYFHKIILPVLALLFCAVTLNIFRVKLGYAIERTKKEAAKLSIENDYLAKKIAHARSPKNLEVYAASAGLKYPEPYSIVIIDAPKETYEKKRGWLSALFSKTNKS
ncbi:MAG: hypothetical protein GX447_01740 [Elusimicrobia bacterium]|nr:hypothetical protein [Elusimicrobiota bacterium]